jgi:hypothetical protein
MVFICKTNQRMAGKLAYWLKQAVFSSKVNFSWIEGSIVLVNF